MALEPKNGKCVSVCLMCVPGLVCVSGLVMRGGGRGSELSASALLAVEC